MINTIVRNRYGDVVMNYSLPDGTDVREGANITYTCTNCSRDTSDLLTHQARYHQRDAQTIQMQLLGITPLRDQRGI